MQSRSQCINEHTPNSSTVYGIEVLMTVINWPWWLPKWPMHMYRAGLLYASIASCILVMLSIKYITENHLRHFKILLIQWIMRQIGETFNLCFIIVWFCLKISGEPIITASGSCIPSWCLTEVEYNRFISGLWNCASYIRDILLLWMYASNEIINVMFRCIAVNLHYLYYRRWHIRFGALIRLNIKTTKLHKSQTENCKYNIFFAPSNN